MTVADLDARLSAAELTEWMAYDTLAPIGPERADLNAGVIAATIANVNRGKGRPPYKPSDFAPRYGPPKPRDIGAEIKAAFAGLRRSDGAQSSE